MDPGKRNKRITIEAPTDGKGASGGMTRTWAAVASMPVWAAVRHFGGNEQSAVKQGGEVAVARTEFDISYRAGITARMRVSCDGVVYNIRHVNNWQERNESLVLTCDAGANNG